MRFVLLSVFLALFAPSSLGQDAPLEAGVEHLYNESVTRFDQGLYAAARIGFDQILASDLPVQSFYKEEASYFRAMCALFLMNEHSESFLTEFSQTYPLSPRWEEAHITAANYYFNNRRYKKVIQWLGQIDDADVKKSYRSEYYFKLGYSHLRTKDVEKARNLFFQGTSYKGEFQGHHQYYYAHIAYEADQYTTAVQYFKLLLDHPTFGGVVPYYLCQIYYKTGDVGQLLETGEDLLSRAVPSRAAEIAKLIGEGYYQRRDWTNASKYLEQHKKLGGKLKIEDHYKLGFVQYKMGRYVAAIESFNKIHGRKDDLGQNAYYHLASAYLKTDQLEEAQTAFYEASRTGTNEAVKESSLFNYAKLAYQSATPFEQPLTIFTTFLERYPNSKHREEANTYLANLYLNTKDYDNAMKAISAAGLDQPSMQEAYQKVAYFRGVQYFNAIKYNKAKDLFEKSLKHPLNNVYTALANYWLAEIAYRQKDYEKSLVYLGKFTATPGSYNLSENKRALYNKAYAYFNLEDFQAAATSFRLYLYTAKKGSRLAQDATLRLADSYFMTGQYNNAISYYTKTINEGKLEVDYALFQRSLCYGLTDQLAKKESGLQHLVAKYPTSVHKTDAVFELGETQMKLERYADAKKTFLGFIEKYPNSRFNKNARIALGLVYRFGKEDQKALAAFKEVVELYPNTPEAAEAMGLVKLQYSEMGQLSSYVDWIGTVANSGIGQGQLDSTLYNGAFDQYSFGNCQGTVSGMKEYLAKFPDGIFHVPAHYYLAECSFQLSDDETAMKSYEFVAGSGQMTYKKRTVEQLAALYYAYKNYNKAYTYYEQVLGFVETADEGREARKGLMRCAVKLGNIEGQLQYAESLLQDLNIDPLVKAEALKIAAAASHTLKDSASAKRYYADLLTQGSGESQAEAAYHLALYNNWVGSYEASNERIYWMIENLPTYDNWRWKSLLVMAENYAGLEDEFQANYTLDFIEEQCTDSAVVEAAKEIRKEMEAAKAMKVIEINTDSLELPVVEELEDELEVFEEE